MRAQCICSACAVHVQCMGSACAVRVQCMRVRHLLAEQQRALDVAESIG